MDNNEIHLLKLLDNRNYQEAVDFVFGNNNSNKNPRIQSLRLIGEENLLNLFIDREKYLKSISTSKKKNISYSKFLMLAKFSEEFNLIEDMVVDQALNKRGMSSIDDLMDNMIKSNKDGIFPFGDGSNKPCPFIIPKQKTYDKVANFVKTKEWSGEERRSKPRL
jgi:hypothetical protein